MLDDHDLIDGFGTYDDETQAAAVFSHIGARGYFVRFKQLLQRQSSWCSGFSSSSSSFPVRLFASYQ